MKLLTRPVAVVALAVGLLGAIPSTAGADDVPTDIYAEPFEVTGGQEEQDYLDSLGSSASGFSSLAVGETVIVTGAGFGHGVGMGQWGARGQALAGATHDDILSFYYGDASAGTSLVSYDAAVPGHDDLRVNLEYDRTNLMLRVLDTSSLAPGGGHVPATLTRGTDSIELTNTQTAEIKWLDERSCTVDFRNSTDLGEVPFETWTDGSCDIDIVWDGDAPSPSTKIEIVGCSLRDWDAGADRPCQYGRGTGLQTIDNESPLRNTGGIDALYDGFDLVLTIDVDDYTKGISEISYTWPDAALQAQAVAARSYAAAAIERYDPMDRKCACDVYDTSASQRYVGWGHIGIYSGGQYTQENWIEACDATGNEVLANAASPDGGILSAVYSSANGGASENNDDIWPGAPLPYLRSTPDPYDLMHNSEWTRSIPIDYFASRVGLDTVTSAAIVETYVSGSPSHITVSGMLDGTATTKHFQDTSGDKSVFMDLFAGTAYKFPAPKIFSIEVPGDTLPPPVEVDRLWGSDRYATAVTVSQDDYPKGADKVFVATGQNFPDALAVAPLAHQLGGPVLLTRTGDLPATTAAEIQRLGASQIYILGGTAAVSSSVETSLSALGSVNRIWGQDRYATATEISKTAFPSGAVIAYVAVGTNFPDALAGAPIAAHRGGPLLLTGSTTLSVYTRKELQRISPDTIVVLGGGTSIGQSVMNELAGLAPTVTSVAAADRYATAIEASRHGFPGGAGTVYVARGTLYPDALAGGPAAANAPGPILLVPETYLPSSVAAELDRLSPGRVVILGGTAAVSSSVEAAINAVFD